MQKIKRKIGLAVCLLLLVIIVCLSQKFEVVAFHPFFGLEPSTCSGQDVLKMMTWNVHCGRQTSAEHQRKIASVIIKEDADVVLLNEFTTDSCLVLDSILRAHYAYIYDEYGKNVAGDIICSKTALNDLNRPRGRYYHFYTKTLPIRNDSIVIVGVHLRSNNDSTTYNAIRDTEMGSLESMHNLYKARQESRCKDAGFIKLWAESTQHPMIVMGDMNDFSYSAPMDSLKDVGLVDSWWEGGFGYGCTFHEGWMRLRIDLIFHTQQLKLSNVKVIPTDLSDHNPVVAKFKIAN